MAGKVHKIYITMQGNIMSLNEKHIKGIRAELLAQEYFVDKGYLLKLPFYWSIYLEIIKFMFFSHP